MSSGLRLLWSSSWRSYSVCWDHGHVVMLETCLLALAHGSSPSLSWVPPVRSSAFVLAPGWKTGFVCYAIADPLLMPWADSAGRVLSLCLAHWGVRGWGNVAVD